MIIINTNSLCLKSLCFFCNVNLWVKVLIFSDIVYRWFKSRMEDGCVGGLGGEEDAAVGILTLPEEIILRNAPLKKIHGGAINQCNKSRDEDPLIFGPPDPVLFSLDPDPTCNNGFIKIIFILNTI